MNSREILVLKQKILSSLSKQEVKDAFHNLATLVANAQNWRISEKIDELESNYKYMLHYLFEGVQDPDRKKVYNSIIKSIYELTDDVCDELLLYESSNFFYDRLRQRALKTKTLNDFFVELKELSLSLSLTELIEESDEKDRKTREITVKIERAGIELFNYIHTSPRTDKNARDEYNSFLLATEIPTREKCLFVSALTLSLFHRFDENKVSVLLDATISDVPLVRVRAVIGLVFILLKYDDRWKLYPELQNKLESYSERIDFQKSVLRTIIQIIRSRDTERISKKVTEEILPQMMKFSRLSGKKINMEDLMGETDFMDKNPEWQKELEDSGLSKKLQEYSELQMEGADVFHSTFSQLKTFSFFAEISNWFLPFDPNYSEISGLFPNGENNSLLKIAIADSGHMCNSDKYSFCFSLLQVPQSNREMMMNRMGAESEQLKQMQEDAKSMNPKIDDEVMSNQYMQDLYRFYKLNSRKNDFFDIFNLSLDFYSNKSLLPLISDPNSMTQIANYCFDKNFFDVALSIFQRIANEGSENGTVWQKIGYCLQMQDKSQEALDAYLKADLMNPQKSWNLRRIGQLYRSLNKPKEALSYFEKAAQLTPDNLSIQLNIGHCLLEMKEYQNALNMYFKVEVLDSKSNKAHRPIAWTAFLLKKYDVAERYYDNILKEKPTPHDYLNAGHVQLVTNNLKQAINYYRHTLSMLDSMKEFKSLLLADKNTIIEHGVNEEIFPYLLDQIKYLAD